uniref:Uncharacterized protein n=1 Tax=Bosea sp. NBC_00436 TaxID=2969620 RepID=A0A9E7ZNB0_9HYPH
MAIERDRVSAAQAQAGERAGMTNVVRFPKSNLSDVPAMLRKLADDIEAGERGDVSLCLVVLPRPGDWPAIFGFGPEGDTSDAALVGHFEIAKNVFVNNLLDRT